LQVRLLDSRKPEADLADPLECRDILRIGEQRHPSSLAGGTL
jgi:hypothetical protein